MKENRRKQFRDTLKTNPNHPLMFIPENQQALFNSKKSTIEVIYTDKIDHTYDHLGRKADGQR